MPSNMDAKLKTQLKDLDFDFSQIRNDATREDVNLLLNGIEQFSHENDHLTDENQRLKDEINRLQGEQGKPNIRAGKKEGDISSEKERKIDPPPKKKKSKAKKHKLNIHLKKTCKVFLRVMTPSLFKTSSSNRKTRNSDARSIIHRHKMNALLPHCQQVTRVNLVRESKR